MPRLLRCSLGLLLTSLLIGGPLGYGHYRNAQSRNFREVREDVLYRSGQMSIAGLQRAVHDHGIKTVISLRDPAHAKDGPTDYAEEKYCLAEEIRYFRLSPRPWVSVERFREIMENPENYPILMHCYRGVHRSGAFSAIYRMEYERWTNEQAIAELRANGYTELDDELDLLGFLEQYRPRWQDEDAPWRAKGGQ